MEYVQTNGAFDARKARALGSIPLARLAKAGWIIESWPKRPRLQQLKAKTSAASQKAAPAGKVM